MKKIFLAFIVAFFLLFIPNQSFAASSNSFVNVVNPIRGSDFWDIPNQKPIDAVAGQAEILRANNTTATWLLRYDALKDSQIVSLLKDKGFSDEKGLFLEITPTITKDAGVNYRQSQYWHFAESVLLTGYEVEERHKLIDTAFEKFKNEFGNYPKSVGAWWIDAGSLEYMQQKYDITGALIVADQYSTDNYQIWGQYWSTPYYPRKQNALYPAQNKEQKIPIVMMQWAARDPVNGYGKGVEESTYSVQANDYIDYHNLDINYFSKLVDIYTSPKQNAFGEIVVGLENSYNWQKYKDEYERQIKTVLDKQRSGALQVTTMQQFSSWYKGRFPDIPERHSIIADDPLGSDRKVIWYMDPYYRAGWFVNNQGSVFRDVRQYVEGDKEPCLEVSCKEVNFATFKTRSLDEVTFSDKYVVDPGRVRDFSVAAVGEELQFKYTNGAGKLRQLAFLPRDIRIDDKTTSIDSFILLAKQQQLNHEQKIDLKDTPNPTFYISWVQLGIQFSLFVLFFILFILIPGVVLTGVLQEKKSLELLFLAIMSGFALFTLSAFVSGLFHSYWLLYGYGLAFTWYFLHHKLYREFPLIRLRSLKDSIPLLGLLIIGTFFQVLAVWRSGWVYDFGMGFWGPTGHDHIWHQALNNQIVNGLPPQNPIFAGTTLTNYHYFFNLLVGTTAELFHLDLLHLLYRFYPLVFSLLLGVGFYLLAQKIFKDRALSLMVVYFTYFGSSFGWIVDYFRTKTFGGESNFWINQPVSFNLNPPFAFSLIMVVAVVLLFQEFLMRYSKRLLVLLVIVIGILIEIKVYAGLVVLSALLMVGLQQLLLQRSIQILRLLLPAGILSAVLFIPQNSNSGGLVQLSPLWFIDSMVDSPDRLGMTKLAEARMAYLARGDHFKYLLSEILGFFIFLIGNLGTRFVGLLLLPFAFTKRVRNDLLLSFILWMISISFIIPLLFIQKGTPWNTIQFSYYAIYFSSLFVSVLFLSLLRKLKGVLRMVLFLFVAFVLIITPISSFSTFVSGFGKIPPARLPFGEMEGLQKLADQPVGVVLTHPFDKTLRQQFDAPYPLFAYDTSSYVSAFSKKPTYLEDETQLEIFQIDYQDRLVGATEFFRGRDASWSSQFLRTNHIRYIYLPTVYGITLNEEDLNISKIFENSQIQVFRVN